jgi:hypothetical protein
MTKKRSAGALEILESLSLLYSSRRKLVRERRKKISPEDLQFLPWCKKRVCELPKKFLEVRLQPECEAAANWNA